MKVNLSEHLKEHPNYLIPALVLADEGELAPLFVILKHEKAVFDILRNARAYAGHMGTYNQTDYPISVNGQGEIIKQPERLAGLILAGKDWFWSLYGDRPGSPVYGEDWLKDQAKEIIDALTGKMRSLTGSQDAVVELEVPSMPVASQKESVAPEKNIPLPPPFFSRS